MENTMRGNGRLTLIDGNENATHAVDFKFDGIDTMSGIPGLPLKSEGTSYSGRVSRSDKGGLENGVYELHTDDGVKLLVQNRGSIWSVLGPVP
jgi:hypothetical protein